MGRFPTGEEIGREQGRRERELGEDCKMRGVAEGGGSADRRRKETIAEMREGKDMEERGGDEMAEGEGEVHEKDETMLFELHNDNRFFPKDLQMKFSEIEPFSRIVPRPPRSISSSSSSTAAASSLSSASSPSSSSSSPPLSLATPSSIGSIEDPLHLRCSSCIKLHNGWEHAWRVAYRETKRLKEEKAVITAELRRIIDFLTARGEEGEIEGEGG